MFRIMYGNTPLYEPGTTAVAFDARLKIGLNASGSLTFSLPPTHPLCGKIKLKSTEPEISVYDGESLLFKGRATDDSHADFQGSMKYVCEGELSYLRDSIVRPYSTVAGKAPRKAPETVDGYFAWLINVHNDQVEPAKQFNVGVNQGYLLDKNNYILRSSSEYPTTSVEIRDKIFESSLGGYVRSRYKDGKRYIDLIADTDGIATQRIEFGKNLLDFARKRDGNEVCTAVIPLGKQIDKDDGDPDDAVQLRLDISGEANGDIDGYGRYKKQGDYIFSVDAVAARGKIFGTVIFDDVGLSKNLVTKGVEYLEKQIYDIETIAVKAVDLSRIDPTLQPIRVGDYVRVTSAPHGYDSYMLCTEIDYSITNPGETTFTLGMGSDSLNSVVGKHVAKLNSEINNAYENAVLAQGTADNAAKDASDALGGITDIQDQLANLKGERLHIRYSATASGANMTDVPNIDTAYIGIYSGKAESAPEDPAQYAWSLIKGSDGVPGKPGSDGSPSYLHVKWSDDDGATFTADGGEVPGAFMGTYVDAVEADSSETSDYAWVKVKGDNGKQLYTWIKYADTPTSGMSDSPTNKKYIGLAYNKESPVESVVYGDYAWSLCKGDQGVPGEDGTSLFTWIKYADSASGSGMSDDPSGKKYIGLAYNRPVPQESRDPSDYAWSLIKGDKGDQGVPGDDGEPATSADIGNSAVAIPCASNGATVGAATITVPFWGYVGAERKKCTAVATGMASGITVKSNIAATESANGSLVFDVAANSTLGGGSAGIVTVTLTCNGQSYSRYLTWSKSLQGADKSSNYLYYDSARGVVVCPDASKPDEGTNVQLTSSSLNVRNGTAVLSRFAAKLVELGKNATDAVISMCGGALKILTTIVGSTRYSRITTTGPTVAVGMEANRSDVNGGGRVVVDGSKAVMGYNDYTALDVLDKYDSSISVGIDTVDLDSDLVNANGVFSVNDKGQHAGNIKTVTKGSATTTGLAQLVLGNETANGNVGNARGSIYMYGMYNAFTCVLPGNNSSVNNTLNLSAIPGTGTLPAYKVLYSNASGNSGTVTMSETAANFSMLEIFFKTNDGDMSCTRIWAPNGKVANLSSSRITMAAGAGWTKSKQISISGTTLAYTGYAGESGIGDNSGGTNYTGSILICYVLGWK